MMVPVWVLVLAGIISFIAAAISFRTKYEVSEEIEDFHKFIEALKGDTK